MSLLVRRNVNSPALRNDLFGPFQQLFNEFYDDFFKKESIVKVQTTGFPKMDIGVENGKFFIKAAVSGFTADDITIEITPENILRITGQMNEKYKTSDQAKCWVKQFCQRQFVKEIELPDDLARECNAKDVCGPSQVAPPTATLTDGVLLLTWDIVPHVEEKPKIRVVPIKSE